MGDFKLTGFISLLPIFAQKHLPQSHHDYYKILLTSEKNIIKEPIYQLGSLDKQLEELYNKYIAVSFDWPIKSLSDCRKNGDILEITYVVRMPMLDGCVKNGKLINIRDFFELGMEEYYGRIVSRTG